jgi:hypothetical protein
MILIPFSLEKSIFVSDSVPPLSHLMSCTPTPNLISIFLSSGHYLKKSSKPNAICDFVTNSFLWWVTPTSNPQSGGLPLISCPLLLIQYFCSYPPHMDAISSIHNLRAHHAVLVRDTLNMEVKNCEACSFIVSHICTAAWQAWHWMC